MTLRIELTCNKCDKSIAVILNNYDYIDGDVFCSECYISEDRMIIRGKKN